MMINIKKILRVILLKLYYFTNDKKKTRAFLRKSLLILFCFTIIVIIFSNIPSPVDSVPASTNQQGTLNTSSDFEDIFGTQPWRNKGSTKAYIDLPDDTPAKDIPPAISSKLVVIDPGHGGIDPGTVSEELKIYEKDIVLDIGLKLGEILEKAGVSVHLTRATDIFMKPSEKIAVANEMDAALFVSLHCDAFDDKSVRGISTHYYPSDYAEKGNLSGKNYAKTVQSELSNISGIKSRGIISSKKLIVLFQAKMPAILIELGFLSNTEDLKLLTSDDFKVTLAESIAEGIIKSLEQVD